jgi:diguanylate cyclase (GGDEF)-like protein/putative nucleotidyltransferase with HDIG domain
MANEAATQDSIAEMALVRGITLVGLAVLAYAGFELINSNPDLQWIWLAVITVLVVSRLDIHIPQTWGSITLSDTFTFITLSLYGIVPAVVLAGVDAAVSSVQNKDRRRAAPFNTAIMSLSVYVSATIAARIFGDFRYSSNGSPISRLAMVLGFFAMLHYLLSAGLVGAIGALRRPDNRLRAWGEHLLWSSVSYFVGAAAACLVLKLIAIVSLYGFLMAVPVLAFTYLTFRSHLNKAEASVQSAEEAGDLHLHAIEALAVAMDAKGEVRHDHVQRVQIYATGLAGFFGLSDAELQSLKAAAVLHDVGKLAIPDYILTKPGPLTPEEFERMKEHTVVGADILERVRFPYPLVPVVRHHHERWDGLGYPDGLRGDQIPIGARILSVANCFDSLRQDRRYRKAKTRGEAIAMLKEGAGKMFDPEVVRVFLEHLQEFEAETRWQGVGLQPADHGPGRPRAPLPLGTDNGRTASGRLQSANLEVLTLFNIADTIAASLDLRDAFAVFSSRLGDIVSYTTCVLYLLRPDSGDVEVAHASGRNFERLKGKKVAIGSGIAGWVIANQQPIFNCDPRLDLDAFDVDITDKYQTATVVPLLKDGDVLGALGLYSANLAAYEPYDLRLIEAVAKLASDAVAKAVHHKHTVSNALTDPLTGLPNARALRHRFEDEADRARRHKDRFTIVLMDLDGFRHINEQVGHQMGDAVLRDLGRLFASETRPSDFIARFTGDEFVAILEAGAEEATDLVHRLQKTIEEKGFGPLGGTVRLGMSAGCATFGPDGTSLDELLLAANRGMYADKARRKAAISRGQNSGNLEVDQYRIM